MVHRLTSIFPGRYNNMRRFFYILSLFILLLSLGCQKNKRHLVVSKIKSTAKLATTETIIDKVVIGKKRKSIVGIITISNAEFVAYSKAVVKTGIDLTKIKKNDIVLEDNIIEINLPAIEVLDFVYSFNDFEIDTVLSNNDIFNKIDVIDQEEFFRMAEIDIRKQLKYMGITEQTQENTRKLMEGLLKNLGYEEIYITFSDSTNLIPQVNIIEPESE
jgi:Protein of unknown function (DUF4230)